MNSCLASQDHRPRTDLVCWEVFLECDFLRIEVRLSSGFVGFLVNEVRSMDYSSSVSTKQKEMLSIDGKLIGFQLATL